MSIMKHGNSFAFHSHPVVTRDRRIEEEKNQNDIGVNLFKKHMTWLKKTNPKEYKRVIEEKRLAKLR